VHPPKPPAGGADGCFDQTDLNAPALMSSCLCLAGMAAGDNEAGLSFLVFCRAMS
jgi:hypothetical protein